MSGNYRAALKPFQRMCEAGSVLGCLNLSVAHSELGDDAAALKLVRPFCESGIPVACVNAAWFGVMRGRGELAEKLADRGLELEPEEPALYVNRGHARLILGNEAGALEDYRKAMTLKEEKLGTILGDLETLGTRHPRVAESAERVKRQLGDSETPVQTGPTVTEATPGMLEARGDGKQLLVAADPEAARGPGAPVPSKEHEAWSMKVLTDAINDAPDAAGGFAEILFMGPALWDRLHESLGTLGVNTSLYIPQPNGSPAMFAARTFLEDQGAVAPLLKNRHFKTLLKAAQAGGARAATAEERGLVYSMISFEIEGEPVTVVGEGDLRLAICGDAETGIGWLELIGGLPMRPASRGSR